MGPKNEKKHKGLWGKIGPLGFYDVQVRMCPVECCWAGLWVHEPSGPWGKQGAWSGRGGCVAGLWVVGLNNGAWLDGCGVAGKTSHCGTRMWQKKEVRKHCCVMVRIMDDIRIRVRIMVVDRGANNGG